MARPTLRSPHQSLPVRLVLGLYEFAASLKLAVTLIFSLAAVLGWATFVEMDYGLQAVHFGLYDAWWFGLLGGLLAVNIFCAAVIRYPWKRHQTGFVITHIGLLTLLFGCLLTRRGGIDAQMAIVEGQTNNRAFADNERIELTIQKQPAAGKAARADEHETVDVISIPFHGGPFNWQQLDEMRRMPNRETVTVRGAIAPAKLLQAIPNALAWNLASIDRGVIYDREGIRLEALDYYSSAEEINVPRLRLAMTTPQRPEMDEATGREKLSEETWTPIELSVAQGTSQHSQAFPYGVGQRQRVGGGGITFFMTGSPAALDAFLQSAPDKALGLDGKGQIVFFAGGKKLPIKVEDHVGQGPFPLGESGLTAELVSYFARPVADPAAEPGAFQLTESKNDKQPVTPAVELRIRRGDEPAERMLLFADDAEFDMQANRLGVYASYWVDAGEKTSTQLLAGQGGSRIDILQGPDQKLYYRYWNRRDVVTIAELPTDGAAVDAFKMPIAQLKMKVEDFIPAKLPGKKAVPMKFNKAATPPQLTRAVQLRMTVDGKTEEFWLLGPPQGAPMLASEQKTIAGRGRLVTATFPLESIDVGYQIRLDDFERRLDPGTSQPSHYSSTVDFLSEKTGMPVLSDVFITMNAPVDFSDPRNGRSYRLFQESFMEPRPGTTNYTSVLTVNYDPGRGIKYCGSLLVVAGIVTMFYMRAYFFTPTKQVEKKKAPERELVAV